MDTISRLNVVLLGNFNPAIHHPEWYDRNQILPPNEVRDIARIDRRDEHNIDGVKVEFIGSNVYVSGTEAHLALPSYRIKVTPDRFDVTTTKKDKFTELQDLVASTFRILNHTPITAIGINFVSILKFREPSIDLVHRLFCADASKIGDFCENKFYIDSRIRYSFRDSEVKLIVELKEQDDKIGINFNYHKLFDENDDTDDAIRYLLDNCNEMMNESDKVIRALFGDPDNGGNN